MSTSTFVFMETLEKNISMKTYVAGTHWKHLDKAVIR